MFRKLLDEEEDDEDNLDIILPLDTSYRPLEFDLPVQREYEVDFDTAMEMALDEIEAEEREVDMEEDTPDGDVGTDAIIEEFLKGEGG